jgi:RNA polymerase sigma-70 factor (ECF subfamily)
VVPLPGPVPDAGAAEIPALDDDTERTLVARASGDPDAFASLYRAHVGAVYRFLVRRSRSEQVAEDVTSATFERALIGIDTFEWRPGGLRGWLYRIAANQLAGYHRDRQRATTPQAQRSLIRYVERPTDGDLDHIEQVIELEAARDQLVVALDALAPHHQEVLALRFLSDLSVTEAADALGCSKGALSVRCHRALAALRTRLEQPDTDPTQAEEVG